jgi:hypothetical protein
MRPNPKANKRRIVAADGHLAAVALLGSADVRLQLQAAAVLGNLAFHSDNKQARQLRLTPEVAHTCAVHQHEGANLSCGCAVYR